jgi:AcrR family transcriptional regulator
MTDLPAPLSRRDMQRMTRERLVFTARDAFAREGYHGARLDRIAKEAGFSKGAVYSNFANKAELFLAVLDANIEASLTDPVGGEPPLTAFVEDTEEAAAVTAEEVEQAVRGMGLATLEFVAYAARDPELAAQCAVRIDRAVGFYAQAAEDLGLEVEGLSTQELGGLFMALDYGVAVLTLAGATQLSDEAVDRGMALLAGPSWAARMAGAEVAEPGAGDGAGVASAAGESDDGARSSAEDDHAASPDQAGSSGGAGLAGGREVLSAGSRETLRQAMGQRLRRAMPTPTPTPTTD